MAISVAATSNEKNEMLILTNDEIALADVPGCASDCVQWAKVQVFQAAGDNGEHPNDDPIYMNAYMFLYTNCYNNCVGGIIGE